MATRNISREQFNTMAEDAIEHFSGACFFQRKQLLIGAMVDKAVASCLLIKPTDDTRVGKHITKLDLGDDHGGEHYAYTTVDPDTLQQQAKARIFPPTPPPVDTPREGQPVEVDVSHAAALIYEEDPSRVFICTGAGISKAGKAPIADHPSLCQQIGLCNDGDRNQQLGRHLLASRDACEHALHQFTEFYGAMFKDASTPAHVAIAGIARRLEHKSTLITTNHDLKHQAEGSRITSTEIVTGWQAAKPYGLSDYRETKRQQAHKALVEDAASSQLAVVVGASPPALAYNGMVAGLRQANPDISILSINPDQPQSYLGGGDYYLTGDAQKIMNHIAHYQG